MTEVAIAAVIAAVIAVADLAVAVFRADLPAVASRADLPAADFQVVAFPVGLPRRFPGGPPGGGFGGGSPWGGGGGDRPSFDPSEMLKRLDRNGNNAIDPDEMEGPARFMIDRMARDNPNIRTDRPIPLDTLRQSFDRMRAERSGGSSSGSPGSDSRDGRDNGGGRPSEPAKPKPLVPGFGEEKITLDPVLGFGSAGELFDIDVTDDDLREARDRLSQSDRNKNGQIDKDEMDGRWSGNPMDFDRNHDGKLNVNELAVRYARRRLDRDTENKSREARRDKKEQPKVAADPNAPPPPRSLKLPPVQAPTGMPEWFTDSNGDGQLEMSEYKSSDPWTDEKLTAFSFYDLNGDGIILPYEARSNGRQPSASSALASRPKIADDVLAVKRKYAKIMIKKMDKDGDGKLNPNEASGGLTDVRAADTDRDGMVTEEEYAVFLALKSQ